MLVSRLFPALLVSSVLFGCSGNHSSLSTNTPAVVYTNGYAGSMLNNAVIYAVPTDVQGQPAVKDDGTGFEGSVGYSSQDGRYSVSIGKTHIGKATVFILNANKGSDDKVTTTQSCEQVSGCGSTAYLGYYSVPSDFLLRASVSNIQENMRVNVNWITHLASDHAYTSYIDEQGNQGNAPTTAKDGMFTPFTIERGNLWLSRQFELADVISTRPIPPSQMGRFGDLDENLRQQGLLYGALLAGGQKLALASGDEAAWLSAVVKQQRDHQGQLFYQAATEFSMCALYRAAHDVLEENRVKQTTPPNQISNASKGSVTAVLAKLNSKKTNYCAQPEGSLTAISVSTDEIKNWTSVFANAKEFVKDLNERFVNMECKATKSDLDGDGQIESFFDCDYVERTKGYYDDLEILYKNNQAGLDAAMIDIRDAVMDYSRCLNGKDCVSANYTDNADKSKTKYQKNNLVLSWKAVDEDGTTHCASIGSDGKTCVDKSYYVFDFIITGTQTANGLTLNHKSVTEDNKIELSRVRVVYTEHAKTPPAIALALENNSVDLTSGAEPLGFDFLFPDVEITGGSTTFYKTIRIYLASKMIGVKPEYEQVTPPTHYNLTELSIGMNVQGDILGSMKEGDKTIELKNSVGLTLTSKFSDAANVYAKQLWPKKQDYFTPDSGVAKQDTITDLFGYSLQQQKEILISYTEKEGVISKVKGNADYLDLTIKNQGTNRFEVFSHTGSSGVAQKQLRKCSVNYSILVEDEREKAKICTSSTKVKDDFSLIEDLIYSSEGLSVFAIPAYGTYKPSLDANNKITWGAIGNWHGELQAQFAQGIDSANLRITQEFIDTPSSGAKRAPLAVMNIKGNKKTATSWEIALSAGLDYEYLVDILPTGKNVQSFYLSYYVNETQGIEDQAGKNFVSELGALAVLRGGVKMFNNSGESIGTTLASRVDYELDENSALGCGYNANTGVTSGSCKAVGYLTFRNSLVGVIREERSGVYVVRYSDGSFFILGGQ